MQLYATSERGHLRLVCSAASRRGDLWTLQRLHVSAPKDSHARPLSRAVCLRVVVRVYRAGVVAECEMCSRGLICLITDPQYPSGKTYHTQQDCILTTQVTITLFDYSVFTLLHV